MNAWSNCKFSNLIFNDVVTYNEIGTSICGTQTEIIAIRYWDVHKNIQYTSQKMNSWIINKLDSSLRFCRPKPPTSKVARVSTWLLATPKLYSDLNLNTSISIFGQIWGSKCTILMDFILPNCPIFAYDQFKKVKCSILPIFHFEEASILMKVDIQKFLFLKMDCLGHCTCTITTANFSYLNGRFLQSSNSVQLFYTLLML